MDRCEHGTSTDLECLDCLAIENEELRERVEQIHDAWRIAETTADALSEQIAELENDKALVEWYFSPKPKFGFLNEYLQGIHQGWTVDQWRACCHAAMQAEGDAE